MSSQAWHGIAIAYGHYVQNSCLHPLGQISVPGVFHLFYEWNP